MSLEPLTPIATDDVLPPSDSSLPGDRPEELATRPSAPRAAAVPAWAAILQAAAVSGIPTQLVLSLALMVAGFWPLEGSQISLEFFAIVSLLDTACIALLILLFLTLSGETSRQVFVGPRPVWGEIWRGLLLVPVVYIAVIAVVLTLRWIAPWMQTVETNPLERYMRTPLEAGIFLVVVMLAGGIREELQRAFILHRFEQALGSMRLGLVLFTITFGLLHLYEGVDAAIAIGLLGLFWGVMYIRRRSIVFSMVNHAGFNAVQVIQLMIARSLGAI